MNYLNTAFLPAPGSSFRQHTVRAPRKRLRSATTSTHLVATRRRSIRADFGHDHPHKHLPEELSLITDLQEALDNALAAEQYMSAADIRDQLRTAKNEDSVALMSSLLSYYEAFSSHSLERLKRLWLRSPKVVCQHPLSMYHHGFDDVIKSFATLFDTLPADLRIDITDVRMSCFGTVGYVTCLELPASSFITSKTESSKGTRHGLLATGIFEKVRCEDSDKFEYLMVHHVSSPIVKGLTVE